MAYQQLESERRGSLGSTRRKQHFLYSKVMCWVAVDRAIRLADKRSFPADRDRWLKVRDQIYEEILDKGWSNEKHAFFNITAAIRWTRRI